MILGSEGDVGVGRKEDRGWSLGTEISNSPQGARHLCVYTITPNLSASLWIKTWDLPFKQMRTEAQSPEAQTPSRDAWTFTLTV